jgi:hypothetical protein
VLYHMPKIMHTPVPSQAHILPMIHKEQVLIQS